MSVFTLKLIAVISMIIDHVGAIAYGKHLIRTAAYIDYRAVGRIAFPVFCFLLVNGFEKSSDRGRYIGRLLLFAVISQLPYSLAEHSYSYYPNFDGALLNVAFVRPMPTCLLLTAAVCVVWLVLVRRDASVLWVALAMLVGNLEISYASLSIVSTCLNVYYSLALGLMSICVLNAFITRDPDKFRAVTLAFTLAVVLWFYLPRADYGWLGLLLIVMLYLSRSRRIFQALSTVLWCAIRYRTPPQLWMYFGFAAAVLMLFYNGEQGRKFKFGFYAVYPLHLLVLSVIFIFLI